MKKKLLSMALVVVMLLTCVPLGGLAVSADRNGNFEYYVENGKAVITGYTGSASNVTIPSKLGGCPVTAIDYCAFFACSNLTVITIPDSVTDIREYAFWACENLKEVKLSKKLKTIGTNAFLSCKRLTSIAIPDSVTTIETGAFGYCESLTSVTIGKGVKSISNEYMGEYVPLFHRCTKLTKLSIDKDNPYFCSVNGVVFNKKKTKLILCAPSKSGAYTVPNTVATIEKFAFWGCEKLTSLTVPDSVKTIKESALNGCSNLKKLSLGKGVKTIVNNYSGLFNCPAIGANQKLTTFTVSKDNPYFTASDGVLFNKKKTKIIFCLPSKSGSYTIPNSVTTIKEAAFSACYKLDALVIPTSVKTIELGALWYSWDSSSASIYYMGTKSQANRIKFNDDDEYLSPWHYNTCKKHSYSNVCDKTCNKCDWVRSDYHNYKAITKKATTTSNGYTYKRCSACKKETGKKTIYKASKVKLSKTTYTYNGKVQKPSVTVKDSKGKTISKSNYTVTYAKGRKNVGTYKVTVKFKGNYTGTKTLTFKIIPRAASINKLTAKSKAIVVKVNRSLKQSTGYQIQYSTSSSFKTYKTSWITNYTKSSKTLSGLKAKTTYYVRVRTYKKVGDTFYYSNWSSAKKMKTK